MMKKNFSKALSGVLTMALLLSIAVLPGAFHVSAANENPVVKSEITLTDADPENSGTLAKYDLLADPSEGIAMEVGDTYVFDMNIMGTRHYTNHGGSITPFGLDLLGNPTKSDNGGEVKLSGVEFVNKRVKCWIENGAWSDAIDNKEVTLWAGTNNNYHYRFTVKAYESIRVEVCYSAEYNEEKKQIDVTADWNKIYGLSNCKAGDGTLFYPNMAFLDQDGKITNIAVSYTGSNGIAVKTVRNITLTDTDPENNGTLAKYDLLKDPTKGIEMDPGDIYVFDMDIRAKGYYAVHGGAIAPFGLDLLGNPTKSDNGGEVKLSGVEFVNKNAKYWIENGNWSELVGGKSFTHWAGLNNCYHYRFTVKAYESIRVEVTYSEGYNAEKLQYDGTIDWNKIYGLSDCKAGDGKLFYPNMAFLDQDGEISNIAVSYTYDETVIKTVRKITLTDTDVENNGTLAKYDLLRDPTKGIEMEAGDTYVFDMDIRAKGYYAVHGGAIAPFGLDLLGNPTKSDNGGEVKLSGVEFVNKNAKYWIENGSWSELIGGKSFTHWAGLNNCYHYRFTVKAYESIRVEVTYSEGYNAEKLQYDGTIDWNKIYGLSNCKAGDGKLFYPNMAFLDQDGEISNISALYIPASKEIVVEQVADISAYRTEGAYTAPTKDGYVFAGWFTDEACTVPVTDETANVYAKYVTEDVLSVKGQLKAGTTAESATTDYRFSTTVDSLNYRNIGFSITINGNTKSPSSTTVYKKITARTGDEIIAHDPTVFSSVSQYFHTYTITGIPQTAFDTEIQIAAFWTTQDGTVVTGPARTLTVNMGIN